MNHPEHSPDPLAQLLLKDAELNEVAARAARQAFLGRVDQEHARWQINFKAWLVPLGAAAAFALAIYGIWPAGELGYEVRGVEDEGGYIRAVASRPAVVQFSDQTQVTAAPGARLRIVELQKRGARVSVEQGRLSVEVTHTGRSAWSFEAGPFQVVVTGTRFDLEWSPESERLQVTLHEGSVSVHGYADSGPVPVRAGQRFVGDARSRTMQVGEARATIASEEHPSAKESPEPSDTTPEAEAEPGNATEAEPGNAGATHKPGASASARSDGRRPLGGADQPR